MAILDVRIWPDPILKKVAAPVTVFDANLQQLVADMFETMYADNGIGLAATQVAVLQRVLVLDLDPRNEAAKNPKVRAELTEWGFERRMVFINPTMTASEGEVWWEEGCLSVPNITEKVKRKANITIEAFDETGAPFTLHAKGLLSVAIQHEIDHLNGVVFVDYLSKLKRDLVRTKMRKLLREKDPHTVPAL